MQLRSRRQPRLSAGAGHTALPRGPAGRLAADARAPAAVGEAWCGIAVSVGLPLQTL